MTMGHYMISLAFHHLTDCFNTCFQISDWQLQWRGSVWGTGTSRCNRNLLQGFPEGWTRSCYPIGGDSVQAHKVRQATDLDSPKREVYINFAPWMSNLFSHVRAPHHVSLQPWDPPRPLPLPHPNPPLPFSMLAACRSSPLCVPMLRFLSYSFLVECKGLCQCCITCKSWLVVCMWYH